jgi:adenylate cyclase
MALEIERKFLINKAEWAKAEKPAPNFFRQGYISIDPNKTIRVRTTNDAAFLTIKGKSIGATRKEFEYEIPKLDAIEMLDHFAVSELSKKRYCLTFGGKVWEVDEFFGDNEGLLMAEIELNSEDEYFEIPLWVGEEVTGEERYYNSKLTVHPYKSW